ncbi:hypothetical protein SAMN05444515_101124 [Ectothiorhodospira marina]|uniref:3-deoxy-D-manno-octulosonic-acid transferase n=2 Tax=Ectothiorhodospiraceae TaxID=72276 RepID=A0A1H7F6B5_9GAMM|nr:hypothetical protein SAMN05444515_101124 [Ectothiorhodospira marina]
MPGCISCNSMKPMSRDPYGSALWPVLQANLRDHLQRRSGRARARMGRLHAPEGKSPLIWLKTGDTQASVRLGAELMGAIRRKRLDARLVLTFEQEYRDQVLPRLRGMNRFGLGFGPCDRPRVVSRVLDRLKPQGLILVDIPPRRHLVEQATHQGVHLVAFNTPPTRAPVEAAYPRDEMTAAQWREAGSAGTLAEPADPATLLVASQNQATLLSLVPDGMPLFWWHGPAREWPAMHEAWQASPLRESALLCVSVEPSDALPAGEGLALTQWTRTSLTAGTLLWVDDPAWWPAVASAALGVHLQGAGRDLLWQVLAGSVSLSGDDALMADFPWLPEMAREWREPGQVIAHWQAEAADPIGSRRRADVGRRHFWEERRRVQGVMDAFLQRVFDW